MACATVHVGWWRRERVIAGWRTGGLLSWWTGGSDRRTGELAGGNTDEWAGSRIGVKRRRAYERAIMLAMVLNFGEVMSGMMSYQKLNSGRRIVSGDCVCGIMSGGFDPGDLIRHGPLQLIKTIR